ncbi:MAG TPA: valine--tRNA ligase [Bauldia sp.]|nr:valine--tRNA ligase [Bauldia sp.]
MLDKTYEASAVEPRIYAAWEQAGVFKAGAGAEPGARPFTIVIPPPNVTGSLHLGHALDNTLQDILVRYMRMRGRDVLWQPGTDHAGIATQMVVERQMMERQEPDRRSIGRDRFLEKVWAWKAESGGQIVRQLKRLGASADWSRERFTMDEGLSKAVVKVFVELYRQKLIYKDKRLVNWDPKLQTAISDLEVQQVETKGKLWHFRYPIEGEQEAASAEGATGTEKSPKYIVVATTRPETMLGDSGVAVNPDDERYKDLVGRFAVLPLVGRRLPIIADAYADPATGSGAVKMTPAHDFNDFEVGKRHNLAQISVLDAEGRVAIGKNPAFLEGLPEVNAKGAPGGTLKATIAAVDGQDRFAARKIIVDLMEQAGLVDKIEDHTHSVPHGDRSSVPIEPYLTDQWYVDARTLAAPAIAAVRDGRTRFVPQMWEKTYFDWMENIQPWCISRQLWWGHQIPAWYGPDGHVFVAASEEEAQAAAEAHYPEGAGRPKGKKPRKIKLKRDEDVLDTWFSSALWPFSTLGWPDETPELARYYPTSTLVTGFDIIFFWVARMMMMGLHFMKDVPFRDVYIHALIRDEKGAKMSKSKGNVIDPLALIDEYGADALRFTLTVLATQGRDIKLATSRVETSRNFATKIWNAAKFAEHYDCRSVPGFDPSSAKETLNRWIATETTRTARAIGEAIEAYRFNEAATAAYRFVWNLTCDWYLELSKPILSGPDGAAKDETKATVAWVLEQITLLLHPIMPFLTEELWDNAARAEGASPRGMLALARWPTLAFEDAAAADEINWLVDLITAVRSVRSEMNVPAAAMVSLYVAGATFTTATRLSAHDALIRRLARVGTISLAATPQKGAAQFVVGESTVSMPLAGVIDMEAERARLAKEVDRVAREIAKIEAKLGNEQFMAKAKEEVVEEQRERLAEATALHAKTEAALARLAN